MVVTTPMSQPPCTSTLLIRVPLLAVFAACCHGRLLTYGGLGRATHRRCRASVVDVEHTTTTLTFGRAHLVTGGIYCLMMMFAVFLVACFGQAASSSSSSEEVDGSHYHRALLQQQAITPQDDAKLSCVVGDCLRIWSSCDNFETNLDDSNLYKSPGGYRGNASIEMDSDGDFMTSHYDFRDKNTYVAGKSRIIVTLIANGFAAGATLARTSKVFNRKCGVYNGGESEYFVPESLYGPDSRKVKYALTGHLKATQNGRGTFQSVVDIPSLVDYDNAASVRLFDENNKYVACCDLTPPLPELPNEWSATVEANINNKGYTISRREHHSSRRDAMRIDTMRNWDRVTVITNIAKEVRQTVYVNETFPDGWCEQKDMRGFEKRLFQDASSHHAKSTAQFLAWASPDGTVKETHVPGRAQVRGIDCEVWERTLDMKDMMGGGGSKPTMPAKTTTTTTAAPSNLPAPPPRPPRVVQPYKLTYYFPFTHWRNDRSDHHRMLKRIKLENSTDAGKAVLHYYDYVSFTPYLDAADADVLFDPCRSFPKVAGNCGCTPQVSPSDHNGTCGTYNGAAVAGISIAALFAGVFATTGGLYMCSKMRSGNSAFSKLALNPMARGTALFTPFEDEGGVRAQANGNGGGGAGL